MFPITIPPQALAAVRTIVEDSSEVQRNPSTHPSASALTAPAFSPATTSSYAVSLQPLHLPPPSFRTQANPTLQVDPPIASVDFTTATPEIVLARLMEGNARFACGQSRHPHSDISRIKAISAHQKPMAAILGCADSRAPAEFVLDQGFGDLFVCRMAGNFATSEQVASLEYAVLALHVSIPGWRGVDVYRN